MSKGLDESLARIEVHHHYLPIKGWWFKKGPVLMVQFVTEVNVSEVEEAFKTPSKGSTIDTALVDHLKTLPKGGAIKLPKDDSMTDRSLKVKVNKAAKQANRELEWREVSDGYIARVKVILNASTNGAVTSTTESEATTETSSRRR